MLKVLKEKSQNVLSRARIVTPRFIVCIVLVLAAFFVLDRTVEKKLNEKLPDAIDYIRKTSGLQCQIHGLAYRFPTGVRALDVNVSDSGGRQWLHASHITADISPFRYFMKRHIGRHLIRSFHASDLEVTLYHKNRGGWEFPELHRSSAHPVSSAESGEAPVDLNIRNLVINFRTDKGTTSHSYRKVSARIDLKRGLDSLEVAGNNDERLNLTIKRESGEFDFQFESFGLAILASFLGDVVPLNDLCINARAQGSTKKEKGMTFSISGSVDHMRQKKFLLPPLEAKGNILEFSASGMQDNSRIVIQNGKLSLGGEFLFVNGWFSPEKNPEMNLTLSFPEFSVGNALSALPKSFHPDLTDLKVRGRIAGKFYFSLDMERPRSLHYRFEGAYEPVKILSLGSTIKINALKSPFRHTVSTSKGKKIRFLVGEKNPRYVPFEDMPPSLISAVITAEDAGFFSHKGFSQRGIRDSLAENLEAGRIVRGASTISMQVAKNLFLTRERTFSRKFEETFITMALEQNLSKERIMEIYLNIIEWGDGIYGIGEAALFYFNKPPGDLKPVESAFLASIIARPTKNWKPDPLSRISDGWRKYIHVILCKMYEKGGAGIEDLREAGVPEEKIESLLANEEQEETLPPPAE